MGMGKAARSAAFLGYNGPASHRHLWRCTPRTIGTPARPGAAAAGALPISTASAGGPAIAGALAGDSDTVDGFDAVKASTPTKQLKGRVATRQNQRADFRRRHQEGTNAKRRRGAPSGTSSPRPVPRRSTRPQDMRPRGTRSKVERRPRRSRPHVAGSQPGTLVGAATGRDRNLGRLAHLQHASARAAACRDAGARASPLPIVGLRGHLATLDRAFLPGSAQRTMPSNSTLSSDFPRRATALSVAAGEHTVAAVGSRARRARRQRKTNGRADRTGDGAGEREHGLTRSHPDESPRSSAIPAYAGSSGTFRP